MEARSESIRAQLELPLFQRSLPFAVLSVFVLMPLSVLWSLFAALRLLRRRKRLGSASDDVRVISVGNVSVGGTGKSPVVRFVARLALADGYDVAVMTRGYSPSATVSHVIARVQRDFFASSDESWALLSDETLEHALQLQPFVDETNSIWICQGKSRNTLFEGLVSQWRDSQRRTQSGRFRKLAVILDDALQQTSLLVHRDLIVWDPELVLRAPQMCLPFGPYRMGLPLRRLWNWTVPPGDVIVWSRLRSVADKNSFVEVSKNASTRVLPESAGTAFSCLYSVEQLKLAQASLPKELGIVELKTGVEQLLTGRVYPLCGIARPERFAASINHYFREHALTAEVESCLTVPDHGPISREGLTLISSGVTLITTLKDLSRWWNCTELRAAMQEGRLFVMSLEVDLMKSDFEKLSVSFDELFQFQ